MFNSMPGIIKFYDKLTRTADIELLTKEVYADNTTDEYPTIFNVPVIQLCSNQKRGLLLPADIGTRVVVHFCHEPINNLTVAGSGLGILQEDGTFSIAGGTPGKGVLNNAICYVGFDDTLVSGATPDDGAVKLITPTSSVSLNFDGSINIGVKPLEAPAPIAGVTITPLGIIRISSAAKIEVTAATSTSITSPAINLTGIVNVVGPLNVAGTTTLTGATSIGGATSIKGATSITGVTSIEGTTSIKGDLAITAPASVLITSPKTTISSFRLGFNGIDFNTHKHFGYSGITTSGPIPPPK